MWLLEPAGIKGDKTIGQVGVTESYLEHYGNNTGWPGRLALGFCGVLAIQDRVEPTG